VSEVTTDSEKEGSPRDLPVGLVVLGALAIPASLVALLVAYLVDGYACDTEGSAACARQSLASLQFWVAIAGVGLVTGFFICAVRRKVTLAWLLLGCSVLFYVGWGILNDAAVHGWGSDMALNPF
jgi:hypothetical protein